MDGGVESLRRLKTRRQTARISFNIAALMFRDLPQVLEAACSGTEEPPGKRPWLPRRLL